MNLEDIMLSIISRSQKDRYCIILLIWGTKTRQIRRDRKWNKDYQRLRKEWELSVNWYWVPVWDNEKVVEMNSGDGCKAMWMYLMPLNCAFKMVKMVKFMSYIFYHNEKQIQNKIKYRFLASSPRFISAVQRCPDICILSNGPKWVVWSGLFQKLMLE